MPWQTRSVAQARVRFLQLAQRRVQAVAQLCRQFGISRKTGFKWLARFRAEGGPGLHDRSRRPKSSPHRTADRWLRRIQQLRTRHPSWGAKKIYVQLRRAHPRAVLPQIRTINAWLPRLVPTKPRPKRRRRGPQIVRPGLTAATAANDVWTADFKGHFRTGNGQRVYPLTLRDLFSRYILGIVLTDYRHTSVQRHFQRFFRQYGLPQAIRVDHGSPFAGDGALELSRLSAWWLKLGIQVQFTRRGCPQDNGAHEQMHRVYKAETTRPPAHTPRGQQQRNQRWRKYYNQERPHEALGQKSPADFYTPSLRPYQASRQLLSYPKHWATRRVDPRGYIFWRGRRRMIGRAFGRERIGLQPTAHGQHEIYFGTHRIGVLVPEDPGGMRPVLFL